MLTACCWWLQILELAYLWYSAYYAYTAVIASLTLFAVTILSVTLREQHAKLVNLVNQRRVVPIIQRGWVRACPSHKLVPGDVIVLQNGKAACDMVVLRGSCLVEESMLSGEVLLFWLQYNCSSCAVACIFFLCFMIPALLVILHASSTSCVACLVCACIVRECLLSKFSLGAWLAS